MSERIHIDALETAGCESICLAHWALPELLAVVEASRAITWFECGEPGWPLNDAKLALKETLDRFEFKKASA